MSLFLMRLPEYFALNGVRIKAQGARIQLFQTTCLEPYALGFAPISVHTPKYAAFISGLSMSS